ncbi:MAG: RHS repeat-associated core domain-containing protein, partial [Nitrospira sp.]|nr:RHS repeat-associated core domain-containing protein [Nitrospira sp.]
TTLTYDANGNLTNDGVNTYQWDARNRLIGMSGGTTASFRYDALGRRVSKTLSTQSSALSTGFLYDGNDIVAEIGGGAIGANYLRSLNIDEPFIRQTGTGNEFYHTDALGSSLALSNAVGGSATTYSYEPFGKTTVAGASANAFQYTGREADGSGLLYYRARYYQPRLQRFISEDPIGFRGRQMNLYGYVRNAPTIYIDPYGLESVQFGRNSNKNSTQLPFAPKDPWYVPPADNSARQNLDDMRKTPDIGPQCSPTGRTIIDAWKGDPDRIGKSDWFIGFLWEF